MNAIVTPPLSKGVFGESDERLIRDRIRAELPPDTFHTESWRVIWFLPLMAIIVGGIVAILTLGLPWYANLAIGLLVGHSIGSQALLAHEVLHGALGMSRRWQNFFGWLGFGPLLVAPEFWRRWHNVVHHAHTNKGDEDPDSFGTMRRYKVNPRLKGFTRLAPGSGTWYSYLFLTYSFVFHGQLVLWFQSRKRKHFRGFNRRKALFQTSLAALAWVALAVISGPLALFTVVIPFMMANVVGQGYILTNHFLRPQTGSNNPLDNSMSVKTWRWLDPLHFRFSHHVEHHFFPKMGSSKAPRVRRWLKENYPDRYICPSHWKAIKLLYSTPRVYLTPTVLVDPIHPERTFDLLPLQAEIRG